MNFSHNETVNLTCQLFLDLKSQIWFAVLLWLSIAASIAAISLNILFANVVWNFTVYHTNLRILLINVCGSIVFMAAGHLIRSIFIFFTLQTSSDPRLRLTSSTCKILSSLVELPSTALALGAFCVGLERVYGLITYRSYHKRTKRSIWLSISLLIFLTWTPSIFPQAYPYLRKIDFLNETMRSCFDFTSFASRRVAGFLSAAACVQLAAAFVWIFVYTRSRRLLTKISINRAQKSLAARFQLNQNFGVIVTLTPWIALHSTCHLLIFLLQWLIVDVAVDLTFLNRVSLIYVVYLFQLAYSISFPLVCVVGSRILKKRFSQTVAALKRGLGISQRSNSVEPANAIKMDELGKENSIRGNHAADKRAQKNLANGSISTSTEKSKRKNVRRIHVFSTLE